MKKIQKFIAKGMKCLEKSCIWVVRLIVMPVLLLPRIPKRIEADCKRDCVKSKQGDGWGSR